MKRLFTVIAFGFFLVVLFAGGARTEEDEQGFEPNIADKFVYEDEEDERVDHGSQPVTISRCSSLDELELNGVELNPHPVRPGRSLVLSVHATTKRAITASQHLKWQLSVSKSGSKLFSRSGDLCDVINGPCNLSAGQTFTIQRTESIPGFVPSGRYKVNFKVTEPTSGNDRVLLCTEIGVIVD